MSVDTLITAHRFWLAWCVIFAAINAFWALTEHEPSIAALSGAVAIWDLLLAGWYLCQILAERRRRELLRQRRVLAVRAIAYYVVFSDRVDLSNPRGHLVDHAMLGASRALDQN